MPVHLPNFISTGRGAYEICTMTTRPFSSRAAHGWVLLCALATTPLAAQEAPKESPKPLSPAQLYKQCLPSVLTLKVKYADDKEGFGTGFLALKEGCAVTAWHVVRNAQSVTAKFADGEEFDVSGVVDHDEKRDLALVRVKVAARPMLTLTPADPEVGTRAYVIGAPKGLEFSLSDGLISQIRTEEGKKIYQFSSPISFGNSGGPLLLEDGRVAGIVRSQIVEGQNLNFAVPAIYALGLDTSLPTKPWDQLVGPDEMPDTPEKVQNSLLMAYLALLDAGEVLRRLDDEVTAVKGPAFGGVPAYVDRSRTEIAEARKALQDLKDQKISSLLIEPLDKPLSVFAETVNLYADAVHEAVTQGNWTKEALDLRDRSLAKWNEAYEAAKPFYALFSGNKVPEDLDELFVYSFGAVWDDPADGSGWELGIRMLASDPMVVFRIKPDGWARNLNLQIGDRILIVNNKSVSTIREIKAVLEDKVGESVLITVERNGKEEVLSRKVPAIKKSKKK